MILNSFFVKVVSTLIVLLSLNTYSESKIVNSKDIVETTKDYVANLFNYEKDKAVDN